MATGNKFDCFVADRNNGEHNLGGDVLKIAFTNTQPSASDLTFADISEIAAGNGYSAGGVEVPILSSTQTGGVYSLVPDGTIEFLPTGVIPTFQYIVLYNATNLANPLISWYDYGTAIDMTGSDKFVINPAATLMTGF